MMTQRQKKEIQEVEYSPWAPLGYILDQIEEQGIVHDLRCEVKRTTARSMTENVLRFLVMNGSQIGIDRHTGELMVRAPLHGKK